jgi:hypothetical protein
MSRKHCDNLFNKLKQEGNSFDRVIFIPSENPEEKSGWCKMIGKGAIDNRFIDKRYDKDE